MAPPPVDDASGYSTLGVLVPALVVGPRVRKHVPRKERRSADGAPSVAADGAGHEFELHDFQNEFAQFVLAMRDAGLPPGQP